MVNVSQRFSPRSYRVTHLAQSSGTGVNGKRYDAQPVVNSVCGLAEQSVLNPSQHGYKEGSPREEELMEQLAKAEAKQEKEDVGRGQKAC
ncbi:hypothetical protein AV530_009912 [Patagioenas fasciata monilis]|uniref:Uncharacterized protein n=1 Tax=Patagioenas fasciata monilis TaxID=372326 RepID=A0A1V4KAH6_PATFA|nr:hypothetical protein AV530_009912 [Patagioenas fasciata monilis]